MQTTTNKHLTEFSKANDKHYKMEGHCTAVYKMSKCAAE